ncbi:MAG: LCP family protein [Eubacterium sp.]|nr:LCP family protein [Eubacterium sp.]
MRIFKNRGDIYFSKVNKEKSIEQRFLVTALAAVVAFTAVFVIALGIKYHFSAKEFFAPEKEITYSAVETDETLILPEVSGKTNFILTVNKEDELLFVALIQADLDNVSYKATALKPETVYDGESLANIYKRQKTEKVKECVEQLLTCSVDYYVDINQKNFEEIFNDMGSVSVPVLSEIRYKNKDSAVPYSVRVRAGEQNIKGGDFVNLIRYFLENDMTSSAGELLLAGLSQHINPEFMEQKEEIYTDLVTNSDTNITVRDFSLADSAFVVLTNEKVGVGVYNAYAEYDGGEITPESLQNVKGYYSK